MKNRAAESVAKFDPAAIAEDDELFNSLFGSMRPQELDSLAVTLTPLVGDFYVVKPVFEYVAIGKPRFNPGLNRVVQDSSWGVARWDILGRATSMKDAKLQGFLSPVLEDVKSRDAADRAAAVEQAKQRVYTQAR